MKKIILQTGIIFLFLFSCKSDDTSKSNNSATFSKCDTNAIIRWYKKRESISILDSANYKRISFLRKPNELFQTAFVPYIADTNMSEVPIPTAQYEINGFLADVEEGDGEILSYHINANKIRTYLVNNPNISSLKLISAYAKAYLDNPQGNDPLYTMIIVGFDTNGVYYPSSPGNVFDQIAPCPSNCPTLGQAACDNLEINPGDKCVTYH